MFCAGWSVRCVLRAGRRDGESESADCLVLRGDGMAVACTRTLIAFTCVLLAEQLVLHPEVATHLQVEAAVCARVAFGVTETVIYDPHCLGAVTQPSHTQYIKQEKKINHVLPFCDRSRHQSYSHHILVFPALSSSKSCAKSIFYCYF